MAFASLPWYDFDELRTATDGFWRRLATALRERGFVGVPDSLDRRTHYEEQWRNPGLLFSQACGYDVVFGFRENLTVVAAPCYAAPACVGSQHSSFIVVSEDSDYRGLADLQGCRLVINTPTSHSGMNVMRAMTAPLNGGEPFFSSVTVSGSHAQSLEMVLERKADVASVDCVSFELLKRHRREGIEGLRVLLTSPRVTAPPFVTAATRSDEEVALIRSALREALTEPGLAGERASLLLTDAQEATRADYAAIEEMERTANGLGFDQMRLLSSSLAGGT